MWQEEPLRNRVSNGKGERRNTRCLDENQVTDNEPSDKDEKHIPSRWLDTGSRLTMLQSNPWKLNHFLKVKAQGTRVTIIANSEAVIYVLDEEDHLNKQEKTEM